jgi:hypothetical protein
MNKKSLINQMEVSLNRYIKKIKPAHNTGLAKVAVQCSVSAEPRWLIKI